MNQLSWLIYLADVSGNVRGELGFLFMVSVVAIIIGANPHAFAVPAPPPLPATEGEP